jgi:hypothetical protein
VVILWVLYHFLGNIVAKLVYVLVYEYIAGKRSSMMVYTSMPLRYIPMAAANGGIAYQFPSV